MIADSSRILASVKAHFCHFGISFFII